MSKKKWRLRAVLFPRSSLADLVENGLQAVSAVDRARVTADPPSHVTDSLVLDGRNGSTGEWDYLLGVDEDKRPVIGVEVHPATNGEVGSVIAKKQRSVAVLQTHMAVSDIRRWIWISSGKATVARSSIEWRRVIQERIELWAATSSCRSALIASRAMVRSRGHFDRGALRWGRLRA